MKVGYGRISTADQSLDLQRDALTHAGCEKVFTDVASGARDQREGLNNCLEFCRAGDVLVVWKLDRLARSLKHLIELVADLAKRDIGFQSLSENIDTTSSAGKLFFHVFGAIAEFERDLIRERTNAGLAAARARGRKGGRPKAMSDDDIKMAKLLLADKSLTVDSICSKFSVSRATLYRHVGKTTVSN